MSDHKHPLQIYQYLGYQLRADMLLPELGHEIDDTTVAGSFERTINISRDSGSPPIDYRIHHDWMGDSLIELRCLRRRDNYLLVFPDLMDALVNLRRMSVVIFETEGVRPETVRHLLIDQVLPRMLSDLGCLLLHASAITDGTRAIAFSGVSGAGKSTLAAAFAASNPTSNGSEWKVLADDCVAILPGDSYQVQGTYPGLRLAPDSVRAVMGENVDQAYQAMPMAQYSDKLRYRHMSDQCSGQPQPLTAVVFLSESTTTSLRTLSGAEALIALQSQSFTLDPTDLSKTIERIGRFTALIQGGVRMLSLAYPKNFSALNATETLLLAELSRR